MQDLDLLQASHKKAGTVPSTLSPQDSACWMGCTQTKSGNPHHTKILGIDAHLQKAQLRWCGHVAHMEDDCLPKQLFFVELSQGKRHMSGQKKRYKDTLKASLKTFSVPTNRWQNAALSRATWGATINKGTIVFERNCLQSLDEKRMTKKNRVIKPSSFVTCYKCSKLCASQFGLWAHMRIHRH